MKQINKLKSFITGEPAIYLANGGKPVEQVVIRYKDFFLEIEFDVESGEPTGGFGWTEGSPMTHVPIKDFYTAKRND